MTPEEWAEHVIKTTEVGGVNSAFGMEHVITEAIRAAVEAQKEQGREALAPGRDHLTVSGTFQSNKYPWCHAGFVPLKITDPMARELLIDYANRRGQIDAEFRRDLLDAIWAQDNEKPERKKPPAGARGGGG